MGPGFDSGWTDEGVRPHMGVAGSARKKDREVNRGPFKLLLGVYCSPAATLLPQRAFDPHKALEPQRALLPHNALLPQRAFDPHRALEPQRALLPHRALVPVMVVDDAPATNSEDPHTAEFAHVADVFHTAVELSDR